MILNTVLPAHYVLLQFHVIVSNVLNNCLFETLGDVALSSNRFNVFVWGSMIAQWSVCTKLAVQTTSIHYSYSYLLSITIFPTLIVHTEFEDCRSECVHTY